LLFTGIKYNLLIVYFKFTHAALSTTELNVFILTISLDVIPK